MDSPCIKQTVCRVLKIFQYGKYLVAYVLKTAAYHRGLIFTIENRKYHYIRAVAWDFQHYGILTSVDSDEPLQPLFKLKTGLSSPVKYFTDRSKAVFLLWIFYVFVQSCVCYVLCASVYMCFLVTCWERADLLALVCGVFCEFVTFPLVSWVRCGT